MVDREIKKLKIELETIKQDIKTAKESESITDLSIIALEDIKTIIKNKLTEKKSIMAGLLLKQIFKNCQINGKEIETRSTRWEFSTNDDLYYNYIKELIQNEN